MTSWYKAVSSAPDAALIQVEKVSSWLRKFGERTRKWVNQRLIQSARARKPMYPSGLTMVLLYRSVRHRPPLNDDMRACLHMRKKTYYALPVIGIRQCFCALGRSV